MPEHPVGTPRFTSFALAIPQGKEGTLVRFVSDSVPRRSSGSWTSRNAMRASDSALERTHPHAGEVIDDERENRVRTTGRIGT